MKVIAFISDYALADRLISHVRLTFVSDRPPPHIACHELLMAAETSAEYPVRFPTLFGLSANS
ncbi:MAG: hypothetical protein QHH14_12340 [Clostridiales bacterium]|nr:hypothetical protein [Clostridiales bacterium]